MNCVKCGAEIEPGLSFCINCGTMIQETEESHNMDVMEESTIPTSDDVLLEVPSGPIQNIVNGIKSDSTRERLFFVGQNQGFDKRIHAALDHYVQLMPGEKVLLVYDNNSFMTGKEGFVITNQSVQYQNIVTKAKRIDIKSIKKVSEQYNSLRINEHKINILLIKEEDTKEFLISVGQILKILKGNN